MRSIRRAWGIQDTWRLSYPNERAFTYHANVNSQQIKSRLDRIYIANQLTLFVHNWEMGTAPVPTDHMLVAVKDALADAPEIGSGRWTLLVHMTNNEEFIKAICARSMKLQSDQSGLQLRNTARESSNPQRLWSAFKKDIQSIAKKKMKDVHYKIAMRIQLLEEDRTALANDPNTDTCNDIRSSKAMITNQIDHLTKKTARAKKSKLAAELVNHGEKLGGVWSALNKDKKPRDLIRRLRIPDSNPPQFERSSKRMAELAKTYHDRLQQADPHPRPEDDDGQFPAVLDKIPWSQTLENPDTSILNHALTEEQSEKALYLAKNGSTTGMDGCPYEL